MTRQLVCFSWHLYDREWTDDEKHSVKYLRYGKSFRQAYQPGQQTVV